MCGHNKCQLSRQAKVGVGQSIAHRSDCTMACATARHECNGTAYCCTRLKRPRSTASLGTV